MNADNKLNLLFIPGNGFQLFRRRFQIPEKVVGKITGKNIEQVLKEEVLDPVGLYRTFFSANDSCEAGKSQWAFR